MWSRYLGAALRGEEKRIFGAGGLWPHAAKRRKEKDYWARVA
jgi:hypothetical protein